MSVLSQQSGPTKAVPEHMLKYLRATGRKRGEDKKLMGTLSAQRILVYAPLLLWYVNHGAVIKRFIGQLTTHQPRSFPGSWNKSRKLAGQETWKKAKHCWLRCSNCWETVGTESSSKPWNGKQTSFTQKMRR